MKRAIEEPLRQIVENAGGEGSVVVNKVREGKDAFGYNARDDKYEDLLKAGIIDPTKVSRVALENAASIASMFLTTECVLAEKKSEQPAVPPRMPFETLVLRVEQVSVLDATDAGIFGQPGHGGEAVGHAER